MDTSSPLLESTDLANQESSLQQQLQWHQAYQQHSSSISVAAKSGLHTAHSQSANYGCGSNGQSNNGRAQNSINSTTTGNGILRTPPSAESPLSRSIGDTNGPSPNSAFRQYDGMNTPPHGPSAEASAAGKQPPSKVARPHHSVVTKVTTGLVATYQASNRHFQYSHQANPKRALTKPSQGVKNDGYDNENSDLILYVNDALINQSSSNGVSRR